MQMTFSDKDLERFVHERLVKAGASLDRIQVIVDDGKVTLLGTLPFEGQRRAILKALSGMEGVRQLIDKMLVQLPRK